MSPAYSFAMRATVFAGILLGAGCGFSRTIPGSGSGGDDQLVPDAPDVGPHGPDGCASFSTLVDTCTLVATGGDLALTGALHFDTNDGTLTDAQHNPVAVTAQLVTIDNVIVMTILADNVTLANDTALRVDGPVPFAILARGSITLGTNAVIDASAGGAGARGTCVSGSAVGGDRDGGAAGGGGGGFGALGGSGGRGNSDGTNSTGGAGGAQASVPVGPIGGCPGAKGGNDNHDDGGAGGAGGGAIVLIAEAVIELADTSAVTVGGGGGHGGNQHGLYYGDAGGGGGGAGGSLFVDAPHVHGSGALVANGGGGGQGSGDTKHGNDGKPGTLTTLQAAGGDGGSGETAGGAGGSVVSVVGVAVTGISGGGGGGGGGSVGFIIVHSADVTATLSPSAI